MDSLGYQHAGEQSFPVHRYERDFRGALLPGGSRITCRHGRKHKLWNTGPEVPRLLCCCASYYEHQDTFITES
ncbi:MAG: hypothetical protein EBS05_14015 [Proteobacteria bacterium]|nr:hypothetical protein [Pseudomonadota bacterium]